MASQTTGFLAKRAAAAQKPPLPYWDAFSAAQSDLWSPENPNGHIACTVAENRLSCELVQQGLAKFMSKFPGHMLYYQDMRGLPELRSALAEFLNYTFMKGLIINPDHLSVLSGVGSVIDLLFHCVAEPGAGVLIPAPYYPAFDNDLQIRDQVAAIPVHLNHQQQDYSAALDAAAAAAAAAGHPVAAVMFTHPDNPTGRLYSREQISSIVAWCLRNKVHCVSDEIYANSVFDESSTFTSTAHVIQDNAHGFEGSDNADDLVHIVFGFSKDFCSSGLRMGCLYTKNATLNKALNNISYFCSTPAPLQWAMCQLLSDKDWVVGFLDENRRRMRQTYHKLTSACDAAGIRYQPAQGAMFLWIDLREALSSSSSNGSNSSNAQDKSNAANGSSSSSSGGGWSAEDALWRSMVDKHKIILSPGSSCHAAEPGYFRMCWAWTHPDSLTEAVRRIAAAVEEYKTTSSSSSVQTTECLSNGQ